MLAKSRTKCYECGNNWLWVSIKDGAIKKTCRRPWWQFWQEHCGAIFKVDAGGSSHLTGYTNKL